MIRRHTKGDGEIHFHPALRVVSGNYTTAKRRGVVEGIDFGFTGEVGGGRALSFVRSSSCRCGSGLIRVLYPFQVHAAYLIRCVLVSCNKI